MTRDRTATRRALLDAVDRVRDVVTRGADDAERLRTLPAATVTALRDSGLLGLKLPAVLGGAEADPVTQMDVIEALAAIDPSAGWCLMVGATTLALPGVFLAEEPLRVMFRAGIAPLAAGCYMPTGQAVAAHGGYRITGRWAFASGIRHAEWVSGSAWVVNDGARSAERRVFVVPTAEVDVHDTWHVAGPVCAAPAAAISPSPTASSPGLSPGTSSARGLSAVAPCIGSACRPS